MKLRCESATRSWGVAYVEYNFNGRTVNLVHFDGEKFIKTLDSTRQARALSWRKVADEAGVSASTLTRLSQGKRPDIDSLGALSHWAGVETDSFFQKEKPARPKEPITQAMGFLRADPNLTADQATAIETILRVTYEQFRGK